jgi:3-hexulose-6-phosphate synthase
MQRLIVRPPVIQVAIDLFTIDDALKLAELAVKAGVDWLEAGTPLITRCGAPAIGALARAFPEFPVLADYKTMDGGGRNVNLTAEMGGRIMTVCAGACDATVSAAVSASAKTGVLVIVDTIGQTDQVAAARRVEKLGADSVFLHYGADQRAADPAHDSNQWIEGVMSAVKIPVGTATFGIDNAVQAARLGSEIMVIGHPLISGADPLSALHEYCERVREAYRPVKR